MLKRGGGVRSNVFGLQQVEAAGALRGRGGEAAGEGTEKAPPVGEGACGKVGGLKALASSPPAGFQPRALSWESAPSFPPNVSRSNLSASLERLSTSVDFDQDARVSRVDSQVAVVIVALRPGKFLVT